MLRPQLTLLLVPYKDVGELEESSEVLWAFPGPSVKDNMGPLELVPEEYHTDARAQAPCPLAAPEATC